MGGFSGATFRQAEDTDQHLRKSAAKVAAQGEPIAVSSLGMGVWDETNNIFAEELERILFECHVKLGVTSWTSACC